MADPQGRRVDYRVGAPDEQAWLRVARRLHLRGQIRRLPEYRPNAG
jgi:hypothetical protein